MRVGAWLLIILAFIALFYFHNWSQSRNPGVASPAELLSLKNHVLNQTSTPRVHFNDSVCNIPADIDEMVRNMNVGDPAYVEKSRGVASDSDYAPAQFGADNSELEDYFQKLRTDPDVYSFTPVPTLEDQQNPKTFKTELLANVGDLNPVPFYDGIVAYEDFDGSTYQSL